MANDVVCWKAADQLRYLTPFHFGFADPTAVALVSLPVAAADAAATAAVAAADAADAAGIGFFTAITGAGRTEGNGYLPNSIQFNCIRLH